MTVERASEIVNLLRTTTDFHFELFDHFREYFKLDTPEKAVDFAEKCGYSIVAQFPLQDIIKKV